MPDLKDLNYFAEVANTLSLTRASEKLGISQPSLSLRIKSLEKEVGVDLFTRHKTGVQLTPAGKRLQAHAQQMISLWEDVKAKAVNTEHGIEGRFTLGCHPSVALYYLPKVLPELLTQHQKLELKLQHDLSRNITEAVISMKVDLAIAVNPVRHPDLVISKIREDKVGFWHNMNTNQLNTQGKTLLLDPNLLQSVDLIGKMKKKGVSFIRFIESNQLELLAQLAIKKAGVAILPESVANSVSDNKLKPLPKSPTYQDDICLIYRHENRHIKAIQAILSSLKHT